MSYCKARVVFEFADSNVPDDNLNLYCKVPYDLVANLKICLQLSAYFNFVRQSL
jgi:hypothetical protein